MLKMTQVILIALFVLLETRAVAQSSENPAVDNTPNIATSIIDSTPAKTAKDYELSLTLARSVSLFRTGDGKEVESLYGALSGSYKFSDQLTGGFLMDRGYDEKTREADWFRMNVSATMRKLEGSYASASPRVSVGLPANKKDFADSLRARIGLGAVIDIKTSIPKLGLSYTPVFSYANFAYTTNEFTGNPNSPYSFLQDLTVSYSFSNKLSAKISGVYLVQQTTSGFIKEAWAHGQELSWQANDHLAVAFGHHFGVPYASTRKANQDVNLTLFDDKDSVIYTQLTLSL